MGYIASTTFAEGSQLGLIDCPWQIRVQPGQRVNITMYDFATEQHELTANRGGPEICHVYLSIKVRLIKKPICGTFSVCLF